jgi:biopolymer transport protein ExbB
MVAMLEASGLFDQGGPIVWLQAVLALLAAVFVLERAFFFHRSRVNVGDLLAGLANHVRRKAYAEALHEASRAPGPVARVCYSMLLRHRLPRSDLRDVAQEAGQLEVPRIEKNIRGLLAVAMLAPLSGLLGTVLGLLETFQRLSEQGAFSGSTELSQGIFKAMITTALGLTIALPAYLFYLYFVARAKRLMHRIERAGIEMLNIISDAREDGEIVSIRDGMVAREQERPERGGKRG